MKFCLKPNVCKLPLSGEWHCGTHMCVTFGLQYLFSCGKFSTICQIPFALSSSPLIRVGLGHVGKPECVDTLW